MHLSSIEYDAIMRAINNAKAEIADDTFRDPYEDPADYTNQNLLEALERVENRIISASTPV